MGGKEHCILESWTLLGFPGTSVVKNPPANAGSQVQSLDWEDPVGGGNGNPLQYFCLENFVDIEAWLDMTE